MFGGENHWNSPTNLPKSCTKKRCPTGRYKFYARALGVFDWLNSPIVLRKKELHLVISGSIRMSRKTWKSGPWRRTVRAKLRRRRWLSRSKMIAVGKTDRRKRYCFEIMLKLIFLFRYFLLIKFLSSYIYRIINGILFVYVNLNYNCLRKIIIIIDRGIISMNFGIFVSGASKVTRATWEM